MTVTTRTRRQPRRHGANTTRTDSFGYNARSELTSATLGSDAYAYAFDNVGNRGAATEAGTQFAYTTNELNQYPALTKTPAEGQTQYFTPTYDADGNAVLIWTETGVWVVSYNAQNRPVSFRNDATDTLVECAYDYRGRRCTKKVTVAGTVTLHQRYIYREYLQIACVDLTRAAHPALWFVLWDPTQPTATRPLAIQKDGSWFTYGHDVTKNVWEVFGPSGYVRTSYDYAPFGAVTASGDVTQPFQWSSEFYDSELGLVYYNYRHYSPTDGRWLSRDPIEEEGGLNLYRFLKNNTVFDTDSLGLECSLKTCDSYSRWILNEGGTKYMGVVGQKAEPVVNGCGPLGWDLLVPDTPWPALLWDVSFESACANHDRCYGSCDANNNKVQCDENFRRDNKALCDKTYQQGTLTHARCYWAADKYADAVAIWGTNAYISAQTESCILEECCMKND